MKPYNPFFPTPSLKSILLWMCLISITVHAHSQEVIFSDDFESGELDPTFWTVLPSIDGASGGEITTFNNPDQAASGSFSARMGRSSDGELTTNAPRLKIGPFWQNRSGTSIFL